MHNEYRPIYEIQQIEYNNLTMTGCYYNQATYLPQRFCDNLSQDFGYAILNNAFNSIPENDILSGVYDKFN